MEYGGSGRAGEIRGLVTTHLPGYQIRSVALLGEGLDNIVYEVNGELMVRFCKGPDPDQRAARADREARLF
jgi:hypothetical protein